MTTLLSRLFQQMIGQHQSARHADRPHAGVRDPLFKKPRRIRATIQDEVEGPAREIGGIFVAKDEGPALVRPGPHADPVGQISHQ